MNMAKINGQEENMQLPGAWPLEDYDIGLKYIYMQMMMIFADDDDDDDG